MNGLKSHDKCRSHINDREATSHVYYTLVSQLTHRIPGTSYLVQVTSYESCRLSWYPCYTVKPAANVQCCSDSAMRTISILLYDVSSMVVFSYYDYLVVVLVLVIVPLSDGDEDLDRHGGALPHASVHLIACTAVGQKQYQNQSKQSQKKT